MTFWERVAFKLNNAYFVCLLCLVILVLLPGHIMRRLFGERERDKEVP